MPGAWFSHRPWPGLQDQFFRRTPEKCIVKAIAVTAASQCFSSPPRDKSPESRGWKASPRAPTDSGEERALADAAGWRCWKIAKKRLDLKKPRTCRGGLCAGGGTVSRPEKYT